MKITDYLTKEWKRANEMSLFLLRVATAFLLLYGHGWTKLSVIFSGQEIHFMDPIGIGATTSYYMAAFAEGICTTFLIFGLFSRFASFILVGNFSVVLLFHIVSGDGFDKMEIVFFYLLSFVILTLTGPGKYSLDYKLFGKKTEN